MIEGAAFMWTQYITIVSYVLLVITGLTKGAIAGIAIAAVLLTWRFNKVTKLNNTSLLDKGSIFTI